jgi:hypothetical protein
MSMTSLPRVRTGDSSLQWGSFEQLAAVMALHVDPFLVRKEPRGGGHGGRAPCRTSNVWQGFSATRKPVTLLELSPMVNLKHQFLIQCLPHKIIQT